MPAPRESRILFGTDRIRIEFFPAAQPTDRLACVFVPGDTRSLEGNQHGGHYMAENGFDVVCFKTMADDWFQSVPEQALADIATFLDQCGYRRRVAFGPSMGAYAAIAFSKRFALDAAIAYSPQFTVRDGKDRRYGGHTKGIRWRYEIGPEALSPDCDYYFVYDPTDFDRFHIARYRELIRPERFHELKLPYAGHPTTIFLHEIGLLKEVTLAIATGGEAPIRQIRARKGRSPIYLRTLAYAAAEKRNFAIALALIARQLRISMASYHRLNRKTLELVMTGLDFRGTDRPPPAEGRGLVRRVLKRLRPA